MPANHVASISRAQTPDPLTSLFFLATTVAILLFIGLLCLVVLSVLRRMRRAREAREDRPKPTVYVDAWAESGRRAAAAEATGSRSAERDDKPLIETGIAATGAAGDGRMRPVALVTGGARRIGLAIANALARAGCDIVITYRSSEAEAAAAIELFRSHGVTASAVPVDLADLEGVQRFASSLRDKLPRLDILVHNAAVYEPSELDGDVADAALRHWRINALAPLVLTSTLKDHLAAAEIPGGGAVVAMLDIHALGQPRRDYVAYAMSKAALAEMVRSLARDLAPGVRVNGVAPGVVAWPETGTDSDESAQAKYLRRVPLGRAGTPDDAAEVVRWLALDATYMTGEIIRLDGGRGLT